MGYPEGLVHGKKMILITSRGADYSEGTPFHAFDFMEPYLRAIFGFVGIHDIEFVSAQPVDIAQFREAAMASAMERASDTARRLASAERIPAVVSVPEGLIP
jgi:FMN-dependent NADH-azoreductase